jgi:hypothetical protein
MRKPNQKHGASNLLHEGITFASASLILLQLDKLKFAKRFEDVLEVILSNAEVNITHIESVEWCRVRWARASLGVASLAVLFGFGKLRNNGNA